MLHVSLILLIISSHVTYEIIIYVNKHICVKYFWKKIIIIIKKIIIIIIIILNYIHTLVSST